MARKPLSAVGRCIPLIRAGLIAGVTTAVLAFPVTAAVGLVIREGGNDYQKLPADLITSDPPQTSYMYAADGRR